MKKKKETHIELESEWKVGDVIQIQPSATRFVSGWHIPDNLKNKNFTIGTVKGDQAYLTNLRRWVYLKDLSLVEIPGDPMPADREPPQN